MPVRLLGYLSGWFFRAADPSPVSDTLRLLLGHVSTAPMHDPLTFGALLRIHKEHTAFDDLLSAVKARLTKEFMEDNHYAFVMLRSVSHELPEFAAPFLTEIVRAKIDLCKLALNKSNTDIDVPFPWSKPVSLLLGAADQLEINPSAYLQEGDVKWIDFLVARSDELSEYCDLMSVLAARSPEMLLHLAEENIIRTGVKIKTQISASGREPSATLVMSKELFDRALELHPNKVTIRERIFDRRSLDRPALSLVPKA